MAQADSHRIPTVEVCVQAPVRSSGICGWERGIGLGLLQVRWFPLPILTLPIALYSSSSIIQGWYNSPSSGRHTK
jgi:hypothetical protein